ncbi:hypothetical protein [Finegoldia magna]
MKSILNRRKNTGNVAIVNSCNYENQYLNKDHHDGIISKEQFGAVQL